MKDIHADRVQCVKKAQRSEQMGIKRPKNCQLTDASRESEGIMSRMIQQLVQRSRRIEIESKLFSDSVLTS